MGFLQIYLNRLIYQLPPLYIKPKNPGKRGKQELILQKQLHAWVLALSLIHILPQTSSGRRNLQAYALYYLPLNINKEIVFKSSLISCFHDRL